MVGLGKESLPANRGRKTTLGRGMSKHKGTEEGDPVALVPLEYKREGILGVENQTG